MKSLFRAILLLFSATTIYAQTGPGGVGSTTNNEIWLIVEGNSFTDAGITLGTNGSSIRQWNDVSGNDNHAIQATAGFRPTLETNQANGFASLMFDGSDDRILSSGVATSNQTTIYVVVKFNAFTNNNDGIIQASPAGTAFTATVTDKSIGMWINRTSGNIWGRGVQTNNTQRNISQTTALSTGQFYIINQDFNGSTIQQYVNGATAGSITYNGTIKSWTEFGIARQGAESLDGELCEIIVYTNSLNSAQRIIIDNYLSAKYGLTLTTNDLYTQDNIGNGNYDFEVAGIGRVNASNTQTDSRGSGILRISNPSDLNDGEFLIWGHNNGVQEAIETIDLPTGIQGRFEREWRFSEVNTSGTAIDVGSVDLEWDLSGLGSVTASDLRLLVDTDGDGLFADETPISGATSLGGNLYGFTGVTAISNSARITLGSVNLSQTPLPIELILFEALAESGIVYLRWKTSSETNNALFTVERSMDGLTWEVVKNVPSDGDAASEKSYEAVDYHPFPDRSFYRLKQTDWDGNYTYSAVRQVDIALFTEPSIIAFPNPASDLLHIHSSNLNYTAQIVTVQGRELMSFSNQMSVDISNLPQGTFFLMFEDELGHQHQQKLVIEK